MLLEQHCKPRGDGCWLTQKGQVRAASGASQGQSTARACSVLHTSVLWFLPLRHMTSGSTLMASLALGKPQMEA